MIIFTTTRHDNDAGLEWWRALTDNQYHSLLIIEQRNPFFQESLFNFAPDMFTYDFLSSTSLQQFGKCNENTAGSYTWHSIQQQNYQSFVIKSRIILGRTFLYVNPCNVDLIWNIFQNNVTFSALKYVVLFYWFIYCRKVFDKIFSVLQILNLVASNLFTLIQFFSKLSVIVKSVLVYLC